MAKKQTETKTHTTLRNIPLIESLLKHPLLRAMACGMVAYTDGAIRELYTIFDYYLSDRTDDIKYLKDKNIIYDAGYGSYSYNYYSINLYAVSPEYVYLILAEMTPAELDSTLHITKSLSPSSINSYEVDFNVRSHFVKALYGCVHKSDYIADHLKQCLPLFNAAFYNWTSYYNKIVLSLVQTPRMHPIISNSTKAGISRIILTYIDFISDMKTLYNPELAESVFFDNDKQVRSYISPVDAITMVVITKLMANGHIDDLINHYTLLDVIKPKSSTTLFFDFLKAIKSLHASDPAPMLDAMRNLVKLEGANILGIPQIAFFAMAAVVMSNDKNVVAEYVKLLKLLEKEDAVLARGVIEWLTKINIGPTLTKRILESKYTPSNKILFSFFTKYLGIDDRNQSLRSLLRESEAITYQSPYKYVRLLYTGLDDNNPSVLKELETITDTKPLFQVEHQEPWEKLLLKIKRQLNPTGKTVQANASGARVAYLISDTSIQPILQKSTNGVTWTKGRNIALKTFKNGSAEGMTSRDMKVISCVKVYAGWGGDVYSIDYRSAIYALVGHPYLFTDDASRLKVEITETQPQLSVTTNKNGSYKLETNIDLHLVDDNGIYIDFQNPLSIIVMKLSGEQRNLIATLNSLKELPKEAKTQLSETLSAISAQMTVMSDLMSAKDTDVKRIKGWSKIVAQLIPDNEMIDVSLYAKPLKDTPPYLAPAQGAEYVNGNFNGKPVQARRNLKEEKKNLDTLHNLLKGMDNSLTGEHSWQLDIESTLSLLASIAENSDAVCVEWPEGAKMTVSRPTIIPSSLSVNVRNVNNWFEIEGNLKIDDKTMLSMAELLKRMRESNGRFIRLDGNDYVALSEHLANTLRAISRISDTNGKTTGMSALNVDFLEDLEKSGADFKADESYRDLIARIEEADTVKIKTPKGIQADLRDYQKEGYRWLQRLSMWGAGACLADDMGLGKTLQTICLLYANRQKGASLVVAPTSLLLNWRDEIQRFAPALNVSVLNDAKDTEKRTAIIKEAKEGDVVVTSYGLLVNEQEALAARQWNVITLDEAHTIKNRDTKMSQAAMTLKGDMRVALTGTPLQNRLAEIWNIFQFINPGLLGSFQSFTDRFIIPIERDADRNRQRLLKRILSPFMLRRTKSDVLSELPEKTEITVRVELSDEERALYEHMRQEAELVVSEGDKNSAILALAEITRLRQAACNPRLVQPGIKIESSKLRTFMEIVDSLRSNHHRALVFSQFTSHLALVKEKLDAEGIDYLYLDGSTPAAERARLVAQFQTTDIPLFLISLKAGGLGLNLTAADYVVHLDPWWNPAIEDQASDRSHRIGQQKPVTVYRLIAANTIEEKILRLHSQKKSLADALLEGTDMSARLTRDEILALLSEKD